MLGLTPDITKVAVACHGVLRLTFADGLVGEVNVVGRMIRPVFSQARTPAGFEQVSVDVETGTLSGPAVRTSRPTPSTNAFAQASGPSGSSPPE